MNSTQQPAACTGTHSLTGNHTTRTHCREPPFRVKSFCEDHHPLGPSTASNKTHQRDPVRVREKEQDFHPVLKARRTLRRSRKSKILEGNGHHNERVPLEYDVCSARGSGRCGPTFAIRRPAFPTSGQAAADPADNLRGQRRQIYLITSYKLSSQEARNRFSLVRGPTGSCHAPKRLHAWYQTLG